MIVKVALPFKSNWKETACVASVVAAYASPARTVRKRAQRNIHWKPLTDVLREPGGYIVSFPSNEIAEMARVTLINRGRKTGMYRGVARRGDVVYVEVSGTVGPTVDSGVKGGANETVD